MSNGSQRTAVIIGVAVVATTVMVIGYFGLIKPVLNKLGITNDRNDRKAEKLQSEKAFNPSYAREHQNRVSISESKANALAQQIYDAKGYVYDDEDSAIGAVRDTGSSYNLSYTAGRFNAIYGRDMLGYMKTFMSSDDLATCFDAISNFKN